KTMKNSKITLEMYIKFIERMEESVVPKGVINLVLGPCNPFVSELSKHKDVDLISFTGGIETGKQIMQDATSNMKKIAFELGGKNPNIIFADADFDTAVDQVMNAVFFHAGQVCSAGTRLIVEESIHDRFIDRRVELVRSIKLGNGFDDTTQMGPLISKEHLDKVIDYVESGRKEGATVAVGGQCPEDAELASGFFYLPTVLTGCTTDMDVVQNDEIGR